MKTPLIAAALLAAATSAHAFETDFTGDVSMGLASTSDAGGSAQIRPLALIDAEARLTFEVSGNVTVGIIVPVRSDGM